MLVTGAPLRADRRARPLGAWARIRAVVTTALLLGWLVFAVLAVIVPMLLGANTYTVLTGSMKPSLPPGTLIGVRPTDIEDIDAGDIVTYQLESGRPAVVTHRVVGISRDGRGTMSLRLKGDNNDAPDEPQVIAAQVRGVVVYAVPFLGFPGTLVSGEVRSVAVLALGVGAVGYGAWVLGADVYRARRERQQRRPAGHSTT